MTRKPIPACKSVRYPLACAHCACEFQGTYKQMTDAKRDGTRTFCARACRLAFMAKLFATPVPMRGPCQHCGSFFASRRDAQFCDMNCYMASDRYKEVREAARLKALLPEARAKLAEALRTGALAPCLECGEDFYQKKGQQGGARRRLFCSRPCYRTYLAARYDRWIANPQTMSLPQAYDEFLDRKELPCLIEGCDWRGVHLSNHVNLGHGIKAKDFKRAVGFNLGTGLVGSETAKRLSERARVGVATGANVDPLEAARLSAEALASPEFIFYTSLEGREHRRKAGIFTRLMSGPKRVCEGCGMTFEQTTPMGRTKYCSIPCRTAAYSKLRKSHSKATSGSQP